MTQTQEKLTVEASRIINAPVEKVFKAWVEPDQFNKWFGGNYVKSVQVKQDVRVGGEYTIDSVKCEGESCGLVTGIYKEIIPNKKLVFTWTTNSEEFPAKDTLVTVEFIARDKSTEVVIKHTNFATQPTAQRHNLGWDACLEKLAELFA